MLDLGIEGRATGYSQLVRLGQSTRQAAHAAGETPLAPSVCSSRVQRLREASHNLALQSRSFPAPGPSPYFDGEPEGGMACGPFNIFDGYLLNVFERCGPSPGPGDMTASEMELI